jgi:hypothetical protein
LDGAARLRGLPATQRQNNARQVPHADCRRELFDNLGESDRFSTLDLRMGYHQIRIREGDQYNLAFWGHDDIYMPLRTPFGPENAPALFQRLMDEVLRELRAVARAFIDNTIVHTKGFQAHMAALRAMFEKLRLYVMKVHPKKIRILFPEIAFLGHMVLKVMVGSRNIVEVFVIDSFRVAQHPCSSLIDGSHAS